MTPKAFRRSAAVLLVTVLALAAGAAPASAFGPHRHRQAENPVTVEPLSRLVSFLVSFLDMAGIGMDPNGNH
jgi:hypothetical protein